MANYISQIGSASGFIALGFVGCDHYLAATIIIITVSVNTTSLSGYLVRQISFFKRNVPALHEILLQLYAMDISPNYAATINGVAGGLAYLAGVLTSEMLGHLITGNVSTFVEHSLL